MRDTTQMCLLIMIDLSYDQRRFFMGHQFPLAVSWNRLLGERQRLETSNCRRRMLNLRGSKENCKH